MTAWEASGYSLVEQGWKSPEEVKEVRDKAWVEGYNYAGTEV